MLHVAICHCIFSYFFPEALQKLPLQVAEASICYLPCLDIIRALAAFAVGKNLLVPVVLGHALPKCRVTLLSCLQRRR